MYMYMNIYMYMHMYVYIYTHLHVHMYVYIYVNTCMDICPYSFLVPALETCSKPPICSEPNSRGDCDTWEIWPLTYSPLKSPTHSFCKFLLPRSRKYHYHDHRCCIYCHRSWYCCCFLESYKNRGFGAA